MLLRLGYVVEEVHNLFLPYVLQFYLIKLIESHCVSILTYGIEVITVANRDMRRQLRVAYNSVFRRIFNYRSFQSVRELQSLLDRPTWETLVENRICNFERKIKNNSFLNTIFPVLTPHP